MDEQLEPVSAHNYRGDGAPVRTQRHGRDTILWPWDHDHPIVQTVMSGRPIFPDEARALIRELRRLHEVERLAKRMIESCADRDRHVAAFVASIEPPRELS